MYRFRQPPGGISYKPFPQKLARMAARLPCLGLTYVQTGSILRIVAEHRFHQRNKFGPA